MDGVRRLKSVVPVAQFARGAQDECRSGDSRGPGRTKSRGCRDSEHEPRATLHRVQRDVLLTQRQFRAFHIADGVYRAERATQFGFVDPPLGTTPLGSRLRLDHALFHGLHAVAPGERTPSRNSMRLDDDVGIDQYRASVTRSMSLQFNRLFDPM